MASDPATLAAAAQSGAGYGADSWINLSLEAMTKLWQGVGGKSDFFFSEEDAREATGAYLGSKPFQFAQTLWRLAQVQPNVLRGYRDSIAEYVVDIRTPAAVAICRASPLLGSGSIFQYYVPGWSGRVHPTGRVFTFGAKTYP
jgi:hypothetical protein